MGRGEEGREDLWGPACVPEHSRTLWFVLPEQVTHTLALTMAREQYVVNIFCALKYSKGDL